MTSCLSIYESVENSGASRDGTKGQSKIKTKMITSDEMKANWMKEKMKDATENRKSGPRYTTNSLKIRSDIFVEGNSCIEIETLLS